jgi:hypothetical protein
MHHLIWKVLALFSLFLPTLAAIELVPGDTEEPSKRDVNYGKVCISRSPSAYRADHFVHREHGTILASVVVVERVTMNSLSSHCLRIS